MGDGGQTLHMGPQEAGEELRLRLAQLRVLLGDMCDRTVVLTQLFTLLRARRATRRSSVPVGGQGLGQRLRPGFRLRGLDGRAIGGRLAA